MLIRIFILLLFLIIVPPICLDRTFFKHKHATKWRFLLYLPNILMLVAAVVLTVFETYSPNNALVTNLFLTVFLGYIVTEAILTFFFVIGHRLRKHLGWRNVFYALGVVAALGNLYIIIIGTTYGKYHTDVKYISISSPMLPEQFDGYRIVQISDLHLGTYQQNPTFVQNIVKLTTEQKPDMIAFTGDLVNYNADELEPFAEELSKLKAKDGVFSIMGNHDYMTYIKWASENEHTENIKKLQKEQQKMGWDLLLNEHRIIHRGNDSIAIIGIENDGEPPFPQHGDLKKATRGIPQMYNGKPFYKLLLSHDPSFWRRTVLPETDIQLTLSGHTHGGQLKILGFAPIALFSKNWGGLYQEKQQKLYVSTGLGEALLTFRYGVWPQIDVITLRKK